MPSYRSAANRHSKDANQLVGVLSFDGASHLAGLSGECAIKSILCGHCGVPSNPNGPPFTGAGNARVSFGHFPLLWSAAGTFMSGPTINSIPGISTLLGSVNPFAGWQVHDRYEADGTVSASDSQSHVQAADGLILLIEAAFLSGINLA